MSQASNPNRGGLVREALNHQYPRLAMLVEGTLQRIFTDTQVRVDHWMHLLVSSPVLRH